ncbi:Dam family site-specific DNA-(adenine-N6)-methyltransferase [Eggerthella guodeyinii]|uniref:Site-specific DNA-methyltransferase (adenine-specific) n=1 Tax=Eggerthella guodeyinii TaxID=2690837 RepID=A0A6L7IT95_9ACTN|nr:Dam family site-specific DNA-(adenine-N6)-methyltransferase [Eggerthella guodeyinii]QOS67356.1 Dam family site-specific DNA-(adenine-N6)-methyltransferase [Eggerthella guodeyinii]
MSTRKVIENSAIVAPAAKPFIRWAGGKTRLLKRILPFIPLEIRDYYEPFVGGGAVFFAAQKRISGTAYLSDLNANLINAWQIMKAHPVQLLPYFDEYIKRDSEGFYYEMRAKEPSSEIERAARFFYLNGTSWNHLWRENSRTGAMNTPWGNRKFRGFTIDEMKSIGSNLQKAEIEVEDFRLALKKPKRGDFVYLDPPYLPILTNQKEREPTSKFNKYTAKPFSQNDLIDLADICEDLTNRGVHWLMSNRDTPEVSDLFKQYHIVRFTTTRSLAAQSKRKVEERESPEALIIGESA